jgi:hypothetical protein
MGSASFLVTANQDVKKYDSYFTKEISDNQLGKQVLSYQYILTNAGVFSTGNTFVSIQSKSGINKSSNKMIKLFIPTSEIRIEE